MFIDYLIETRVTMKPHNAGRFWIMGDIVKNKRIRADGITDLLRKYAEQAEQDGITISANAINHREPMLRDLRDGRIVQCGYVLTGSSDFPDDDSGHYSRQFVNVWAEISVIASPAFPEEEIA